MATKEMERIVGRMGEGGVGGMKAIKSFASPSEFSENLRMMRHRRHVDIHRKYQVSRINFCKPSHKRCHPRSARGAGSP